jgi:hypothetical protein
MAFAWALPWAWLPWRRTRTLTTPPGRAPEYIDEIELILERLDGHDDTIAEITHPQSVLNRLFN